MQQTTNYNLLIPEGSDVVNPLTQVNPNFQTIDGAMFANKQATIGTASEVVTGTVHAIIRNNTDSDVFRFTATGAWTAGDTMTLDGQQVTVHLSDGTTPSDGAYVIGAEVLAMVNGTLVTLAISTTPPAQGVTSFNSRAGAVVPATSDYDGSMIDYDNTTSGLNATDIQGAIDELALSGDLIVKLWDNPDPAPDYSAGSFSISDDNTYDAFLICPDSGTPSIVFLTGTAYMNTFSISSGNSRMTYYFRTISVSHASNVYTFTFGDCTSVSTNITTFNGPATVTTANNTIKPLRIYGIKA